MSLSSKVRTCHFCRREFSFVFKPVDCSVCHNTFGECCMSRAISPSRTCQQCYQQSAKGSQQKEAPTTQRSHDIACPLCGRSFSFIMKPTQCFGCLKTFCSVCASKSINKEPLCSRCYSALTESDSQATTRDARPIQPPLKCQLCSKEFSFVLKSAKCTKCCLFVCGICSPSDSLGTVLCAVCAKQSVPSKNGSENDESELLKRFNALKSVPVSIPSDTDLNARLAKHTGRNILDAKPILLLQTPLSEEASIDDIINKVSDEVTLQKQEEAALEQRLRALKGDHSHPLTHTISSSQSPDDVLDDDLPWCNMCNDDPDVQCLDCKADGMESIFCNKCFREEHVEADIRWHQPVSFMPCVPRS